MKEMAIAAVSAISLLEELANLLASATPSTNRSAAWRTTHGRSSIHGGRRGPTEGRARHGAPAIVRRHIRRVVRMSIRAHGTTWPHWWPAWTHTIGGWGTTLSWHERRAGHSGGSHVRVHHTVAMWLKVVKVVVGAFLLIGGRGAKLTRGRNS